MGKNILIGHGLASFVRDTSDPKAWSHIPLRKVQLGHYYPSKKRVTRLQNG